MPFQQYIGDRFRLEENEEPKEDEKKPEEKQPDPLGREMEKIFTEQRKIFFWGAVEEKTAREAVARLLYLDALKPGEEIKMYINSPGGAVTDGMVIYDTIRMLQSPVSTICMGMAASMGSILLSAGTKGRRFIYPHGEVMIHQPSLGGVVQGTSADLEIHAEQIRKTKRMGAQILADNCGQPFDKVIKDMERDYWMNAQEAIAYGIVDGVLEKL
jgi:ATP-dependent Clp protease, protease subunit